MASRLDLQTDFETVLNSSNVYFQPPSSIHMSFPAIVYNLGRIEVNHADNMSYLKFNKYDVKYIHKDPDDPNREVLLDHFPMIRYDRSYVADGMYHDVYTLYY